MTRKLLSTGSPYEAMAGYSRAVVQGPWCFVSGTAGYDYETMVMPDDVASQTHNIFKTIASILDEAGFTLSDVIRCNYMVTKPEYAEPFLKVCGSYFGDIRPAVSLWVAEMWKPEIKVDVDMTALKSDAF